MPIFFSAGSWKTNCSRPPTSTAQPNAITGGSKYGTRNRAKPIMLTFSSVGTKAGTEKRFQVLRTAPASEAREISRI